MILGDLNKTLSRRTPVEVVALSFALIGLVGTTDYFTGYELSFSIFYLLPIVIVTWYGNQRVGFVLCFTSATVWGFVDYASGHTYSNAVITVWNAAVRLGFFAITAYLLGELKTHLIQEEFLSRTDSLTQLLNSRGFKEVAHAILQLALRHHHPTVLVYMDIDNFKVVNDRSGHPEGDRALKAVASILTRSLRSSDIVARLGGDEFAALMPETEYAAAQAALSRLHQELEQEAGIYGWPIGFSIGVAVFPGAPPTIEEAIRIVDGLMYRAKKSGKNRIIYEEIVGDPAKVERNAQPGKSSGLSAAKRVEG